MSGFCNFCRVWHSGSCCHPMRPIDSRPFQPITTMTATMTQPTAVQLRELMSSLRDEAASDNFGSTWNEGYSYGLAKSADRIEAIAASEPAPEPQGGGERERLEDRRWSLMNSYGNSAYQDGRINQLIAEIDKELAALTPKPSTPQAESDQ